MSWCHHCSQNTETYHDYTTGNICCADCGKVVHQEVYTEDDTFVKDAAGGARLAGNRVRMPSDISDSHQRTLNIGNDYINDLIRVYGISDVNHATKYYQIAVERGFTRGRRTKRVAAACLYVACREMEKPFLLIEFSSRSDCSVYELGVVYLQLCKLLCLQEHPFVQNPVDPSLYMHRFIRELKEDSSKKEALNTTALHLVVCMKRDWIQTGRKPSGICAAAIYVSSLLHGYNFSKDDVVKAVHICEATLTKRLVEFENTEAGSLTIEEFTQKAINFEKEMESCKQSANDLKMPEMTEVVCEHKTSVVQSGSGLCKSCYLEFCGGLDGSEPPAFQRAQADRLFMESVKRSTASTPCVTTHSENVTLDNTKEKGAEYVGELNETSDNVDAFVSSKEASADESDTFSDIDEAEVDGYLHDEEGIRMKTRIWEWQNREYMQEQAVKAAATNKLQEKDKRKRKTEAKNAKPPDTAGEAAAEHFTKKKFSSKFNYDAIANLLDNEEPISKE
ncbi:putative transcription factor TFIIB, brf1, TBP-binding domain, cyclin, Cyclin-like superfamily [Helianthus annuus]|nr:putative transcription factor TFIIB, brf1, TBP-binding domain, cyclin, Cyclin-like superfamily [Helianthus annuus]